MVAFRSLEEISLNMLDFLRVVQPDLDTKPGQVARDLFVDAPATEISKLYIELRNIANLQAISSATGNELNLLARNFGLVRGSGSPASGVVVFTTNTLDTDIFIAAGTQVSARNGVVYSTISDASFEASKVNVYRGNGIRLRSDLDLAGIDDEFALEVAVEASTFGSAANIGKFGIISQSVPGVSAVTNVQSFTGGSNVEGDDAFRARVLGVFAGSNTGTALGYANAILTDPSIVDVITVEPGDPLMTRDGTDVQINDDGDRVIIQAGTGGKVDIYIQGSRLEEVSESYIFRDQSGQNDATDSSNDFILGQRGVNPLLDFQQKRRLLLDQGTLPFQPANNVLSVNGSESGAFVQAFTDEAGNTQGSFQLTRDTGDFGGSSFGFDRISFLSNSIDLTDESIAKGPFNGEDALDFTDVQLIQKSKQSVIITNEQPILSSTDRSILTLKHTPVSAVNSITNVTTGQRYSISNPNVDGAPGDLNTTGRIQISGGTLPTTNDELQANYIWERVFDDVVDFDNLEAFSTTRTTQDSIDWGYSNRVLEEEETVLFSVADGYHVLVDHPISRVVDVNTLITENVTIVGGKLVVSTTILNIKSIKASDGREIFFTANRNGSFSGTEITLPTDAIFSNGDTATVEYNIEDIYSPDGYDNGTFASNQITLPDNVVAAGATVFANYIANISTLLPVTSLSALPVTGSQNEFLVANNLVGSQPISNVYSGSSIVRNLRYAPSYLRMNFQGVLSSGRLTIRGTSFTRVEQVFQVRQDGLAVDLSDAVKLQLGANTIPTTGFVGQVYSLEKVTLTNGVVSEVNHTYDLNNYKLKNVDYDNGTALEDSSLGTLQVSLDTTTSNLNNQPLTGNYLRVVAFYFDTNAVERVVVTTSGIQFSRNQYAFVERLAVDSGFLGLSGNTEGTLTITNYNQPNAGSTYFTSYNYTAPKEGERITITYNYNRLIADALFRIENVRPITADVLVKAAVSVPIDVTLQIVALPNFTGGDQNLIQNVTEAITTFLSGNSLGTVVDASDVINAAYNVTGVDRVEIITFNTQGSIGIRQSISADRNSFITAGNVTVTVEER